MFRKILSIIFIFSFLLVGCGTSNSPTISSRHSYNSSIKTSFTVINSYLCYDSATKVVYVYEYGTALNVTCPYIGPSGKFVKYDIENDKFIEIDIIE